MIIYKIKIFHYYFYQIEKRAVTSNPEKLWPHGIIPYEISDLYKGFFY